MHLKPIWFDSLGAKSSCVLVQTDVSILIDPGVAVMHASFPASSEEKRAWYREALEKIRKAVKAADIVVITHYHHDHYLREKIYEGKILLAKNPNEYINDSQRERAENFFKMLYGDVKFEDPREKKYILDGLQLAMTKDFGDYQKRRDELLKAGRQWFEERVRKWKKYRRIPESDKVIFCDGREFRFGKTRIRFSKPLFHGIEFSRLGWVCAVIVEFEGKKFLYSSDVSGPVIEDYAEWIIEEQPDLIVLDGPATYMLGYAINRINLRRAVENAARIVEEVDFELMIYDHHLPREAKFRERTKEVWNLAEKLGKKVVTCAELLNLKPAVLRGTRR